MTFGVGTACWLVSSSSAPHALTERAAHHATESVCVNSLYARICSLRATVGPDRWNMSHVTAGARGHTSRAGQQKHRCVRFWDRPMGAGYARRSRVFRTEATISKPFKPPGLHLCPSRLNLVSFCLGQVLKVVLDVLRRYMRDSPRRRSSRKSRTKTSDRPYHARTYCRMLAYLCDTLRMQTRTSSASHLFLFHTALETLRIYMSYRHVVLAFPRTNTNALMSIQVPMGAFDDGLLAR